MVLLAHICGFSGAGKTTLGLKIKNLYPHLVVKDIDELFREGDPDDYSERKVMLQYRIYEYISTIPEEKNIVLIGTGCVNAVPEEFITISPVHKIWLDTSLEESCTRSMIRQIDHLYENTDYIIDMMKGMTISEINEYNNGYFNYQTKMACWGPLKEIAISSNYISMNEYNILAIMDEYID
jgi:shikimate kinase